MIDCKEYAAYIKEDIAKQVKLIQTSYDKTPTLSIISVASDVASKVYMTGKIKDCDEVGINVISTELDINTSEKELLRLIDEQNNNEEITGIIVQLPLPFHINQSIISESIDWKKDIDGFRVRGEFKPCTPLGIVRLLDHNNIEIKSKHCVIVGRSEIVGKPLANLLLERDATVTVCHSKTLDLHKHTLAADIIISAVGKGGIITPNMITPNSVLIDVGISRDTMGKLHGDFTKECSTKTDLYTTVPNGIGLVTRVTLLENIIKAFDIQYE